MEWSGTSSSKSRLMKDILADCDFTFETEYERDTWLLPNLEVLVGQEGKGQFVGVIRDILDGNTFLVSVRDLETGEHVVVPSSDLTPVAPNVMDEVKIIRGVYRHKTGVMVDTSKSGIFGLVLFDKSSEMEYMEMKDLGKLGRIKGATMNDEEGDWSDQLSRLRPLVILSDRGDDKKRKCEAGAKVDLKGKGKVSDL